MGFLFLSSRLRTMWKPVGRMDCIALSNDFFLIKFELQSDLEVVLKGGPWFMGQHFLAIRKWEIEFKAEETSLSSAAVWIRLLGCLLSSMNPPFLRKLGGPLDLFYVLTLLQLMVRGAGLLDCVYRLTLINSLLIL